ncbi:Cathepsin L [Oopsacas minuta]|uniref:Cathepsin L n=1 Tax=Oopsacas minuta TaxID=111878 RepID=A0AAV7JP20_9METZ|nr:Cathepsin L [Oopsacas minuta]
MLFVLYFMKCYSEESNGVAWREWKHMFNKTYDNKSKEKKRKEIWEKNILKINEFNARNGSFKQAVNKFSDMTSEEVLSIIGGLHPESETTTESLYTSALNKVEIPDNIDWRDKNVVTQVKNQECYGSCWAFSAAGSLEGQYARKTGKLVSFSEQQLIDCSWSYGNKGCTGGLIINAFKYWEKHGAEREKDYPFIGRDLHCKYQRSRIVSKLKSFVRIPRGDCTQLRRAVAEIGPVSVGIDVSQDSFHSYSHGVYKSGRCSSTKLNHGVLVVGYNMEGSGYWIVKNSWGKRWGEAGYFRIDMRDNMCGICTSALYPVI